ncbi:MAG: tryptophan--tRNA ligase [Candidatus Omnitrophica bacterium CG08_land_8_20_14_0_20_41_16]|uniref:Tryptophan--tRNA ligase n=1 Tax=Candidatus Sherwoodlollariibacterium unditelluris TaxID=1974757 RepID=A0A2G9YKK0_9BACT|nr:MAG: tryptophan--tRNA ligase [Candidatus Omnitrophica bacterium CG23_combo_of_CG06-09_8_20_14_all_41_10]PIS33729.1 MAG: tryptophan--tRNA ligase [Candidatus Omnitrophica bacterium CG08_land_8_20_14_0_20_41_16]
MKKIILSGMRPTGKLHLGHLAGALDNWIKLQEEYQCFFMVADWHALMSEYENTSELSLNIIDNVIDWLSVGIDPGKAVIFVQSDIPEHLKLYMVLSCLTPLGLLERCPTYKEQLREVKMRNLNTYGFLGYPVLQAADILLYKAEKVPVGRDQLPHLELTREIARLFNNLYKKNIFPYPDAILTQTPKLLGLDGRKMSKSYLNTINLSDAPGVITKKISAMFTDPKRIKLIDKGHPDTCNVFSYYSTFVPKLKDEVCDWCMGAKAGCVECKKILAENIIDKVVPIQKKREELGKDKDRIKKILESGREKASFLAVQTMEEVLRAINL